MAEGLLHEGDPRARWDFEPARTKVLVTGGAGFIGSTLVPMLINQGYSVVIYDLFRWGMRPLLNSYLDTRHLTIINGDILDDLTVQKVVKSCDAVIHLAGIVSAPAFNRYPEIAQEVNERGTQILVDSLKPEQTIIFTSVENVYGKQIGTNSVCTEETECHPLTPFAQTFVNSEKVVLGANGVVLRLPSAFGCSPRMRIDLLLNNLVFQACTKHRIDLYEANYRRYFLHVEDTANSVIFSLKNIEKMRGKIFNVGHESLGFTKMQICELIKEEMPDIVITEPDDSGYKDSDNRNFAVSHDKIEKLGFTVKKTVKDGIKELMKIIPLLSEAEIKKCQAL